MARDGSGLRRLLPDRPESVAWSPDDTQVAMGRNNGIEILDVANGTTTPLVSFPGTVLVAGLAWSPVGQLLAASIMHNPHTIGPAMSSELVIVDIASGTTTSLGSAASGSRPSWSARGCLGWAAATVIIRCPGTPALSLPPFPGSPLLSWSPDGTRYAITSSDDNAPGAIVTYNADGSGATNLGNRHAIPITWTGDGHSIVFETSDDPTGQLWAQPAAGGPPHPLAGAFAYTVNGVDDGIIVETGPRTGHHNIVSLSVSNAAQHQLVTISAAGGGVHQLTWAQDGRWLLADVFTSG